jgi:hypothetical protein
MAYEVIMSGNTYGIKETLKQLGFKWFSRAKVWSRFFDTEQEATEIANRWTAEGVYGSVVEGGAAPKQFQTKYYRVKQSWIFNLESMHDKAYCLIYDIREGELALPFKVAGKTINSTDDLYELIDEAGELESKAKSARGVTGKEYGRIKEIVSWRVEQRYATCMAAGMSEAEAGQCFEDI